MRKRWSVPFVLGLVLVVGAVSLTLAGEGEKEPDKGSEAKKDDGKKAPVSPIVKAAKKKAESSGETLVITNESLEQMIADLPPRERNRGVYQSQAAPAGEGEPKPGDGADSAAPVNGLELMAQRKAEAEERGAQIAEAEKHVAELQARVSDLEDRLLKLRNPLLARPEAPKNEKGEADAEWQGMGTAARVERSEAELRQARADLAKAQADLARSRGGR